MQDNIPYDWTDERVEQLKTLVKEGLSFAQIAIIMGCVSRNVPLCKWNRIKKRYPELTHPKLRMGGPTPGAQRAQIIARAKKVEPPPPANDNVEPVKTEDGALINASNVGSNQCRYPIGDPLHNDFHFCGQQKRDGSSYCEAHHAKIYLPKVKYERKKRRA
jgi:GcrA cell cycle regulator